MKYAESNIGRVFSIRLEDGDILPNMLEDFAKEKGVLQGMCLFVGGVQAKSEVVVGPDDETALPPVPTHLFLPDMREVAGVGTLFPDEKGNPRLHAHAAMGRGEHTITGCIRPGIKAWHILEVVLLEFTKPCGTRVFDEKTGFSLLEPEV